MVFNHHAELMELEKQQHSVEFETLGDPALSALSCAATLGGL
jgi:hypothetical protein